MQGVSRNDNNNLVFGELLESRAANIASALERKLAEFGGFRTKLDARLQSVQGERDLVWRELGDLRRRSPRSGEDWDPAVASLN